MNFLDKHFGRFGNRCFQSFYLYAQMREGKIPDIFLQDYRYFDKYKEELQAIFGQYEKIDKISIHIRRGKNPSNPNEPAYSDNPFYVDLCKTDYYEKAMKEFSNEKFLVFSDEPSWAKDYFKMETFFGDEQSSFRTMAGCKGHIIANSSFSYMAAYLGGGKTIYPEKWYSDGIERTVCPKDWIKI